MPSTRSSARLGPVRRCRRVHVRLVWAWARAGRDLIAKRSWARRADRAYARSATVPHRGQDEGAEGLRKGDRSERGGRCAGGRGGGADSTRLVTAQTRENDAVKNGRRRTAGRSCTLYNHPHLIRFRCFPPSPLFSRPPSRSAATSPRRPTPPQRLPRPLQRSQTTWPSTSRGSRRRRIGQTRSVLRPSRFLYSTLHTCRLVFYLLEPLVLLVHSSGSFLAAAGPEHLILHPVARKPSTFHTPEAHLAAVNAVRVPLWKTLGFIFVPQVGACCVPRLSREHIARIPPPHSPVCVQ